MKKLLLISLSVFAASAHADDKKFYAGGGIGVWNFKESGYDNLYKLSSVEALAGINVWKMINIEGRVGVGLESSTATAKTEPTNNKATVGLPTEVNLDNYASLYIKPELKNDIAKLYGLVGVTQLNASSSNKSADTALDLSGLSFGAGMGFQLSETAVINLEYLRLVQEGKYRFSGVNLGFNIGF